MPPRVSVIIPCFNLGLYLGEAIESVRDQTFQELEIIVVDDGSTDPETIDILQQLTVEGVMVVRVRNQGPSAARNEGIQMASGEYILPLDADDLIAPTFLEHAVDFLDHNSEVGIVYGTVELFGDAQGPWPQPQFSVETILFENMIVASAVFRRDDWKLVGGYRLKMVYGWEDWDLWLSIVDLGRTVARLPEVALYYRIRNGSRTERMTMGQKLRMFFNLVMQHKRLYLCNWETVLRRCLSPGHRLIASPRP
jgi:glycosyltransferase involved in cell wall biosynthesis